MFIFRVLIVEFRNPDPRFVILDARIYESPGCSNHAQKLAAQITPFSTAKDKLKAKYAVACGLVQRAEGFIYRAN